MWPSWTLYSCCFLWPAPCSCDAPFSLHNMPPSQTLLQWDLELLVAVAVLVMKVILFFYEGATDLGCGLPMKDLTTLSVVKSEGLRELF